MNSDNGNPYVSSIVTNYGDVGQAKQDAITLRDIHNRQGSKFLFDCIAELTGDAAGKFNCSESERAGLIRNLVKDFKDSLSERV